MKKFATEQEVLAVVKKVKDIGLGAQVDVGEEMTVVVVFGVNTGGIETGVFQVFPGVEQVVRIEKPYKLASRDFKVSDTIIDIGPVRIGGRELVIMAGPCSVESEKQIMECAQIAKACGAKVLRGGAFKPRTSPFSFQGLGIEGLKMLQKAKKETGLLIVTEVVSSETVRLVSEYADILQIGARNMQNYPLLDAVGKTQKPVLLKRGFCATLEELLMAADYILQYNPKPNVILCLRGIRTPVDANRFTFDICHLPKLRELTHLPIIADPSHPAKYSRYVPDLAYGAIAMGVDGLIVEIHPNPQNAQSDGLQSLKFGDFATMMEAIGRLAEVRGRIV